MSSALLHKAAEPKSGLLLFKLKCGTTQWRVVSALLRFEMVLFILFILSSRDFCAKQVRIISLN